MPARAILLDALGTLLALEPPAPRLAALLRERHGVEVTDEDARRAMRAEMAHYRARCVGAADASALAALRLECAAIVARELAPALAPTELLPALLESIRFRPYAEVPDTLAAWRGRGLALVVASNWDVSLHDVLAQTGLRALLDGVVTSAEVGAAKPSPRVFEAALELAGVSASEAVHVGDSLLEDVEGARRAGIAAVWLRRARGEGEAAAPAGVPEIGSLDELALAA